MQTRKHRYLNMTVFEWGKKWRKRTVWGVKERDSYHGGGRMVGENYSHPPHYQSLHHEGNDPLTDHTRITVVSHQDRITPNEQRSKGK